MPGPLALLAGAGRAVVGWGRGAARAAGRGLRAVPGAVKNAVQPAVRPPTRTPGPRTRQSPARPPANRPGRRPPDPGRFTNPSPQNPHQHPPNPSPSGPSHGQPSGTPRADAPPAEAVAPNKTFADYAQIASNVTWAMSSVKTLAADITPKIKWTGTVTARGYKSTPLRHVLHYALAVVFGMVRQSRIGSSTLNAQVFYLENRVQIVFTSQMMALAETVNTPIQIISDIIKNVRDVGAAAVNVPEDVTKGVKKWKTAPEGTEGAKIAAQETVQAVDGVNRRVGPGGVWEMAPNEISAGIPPGATIVDNVQPFWEMRKQKLEKNAVLLTREPAGNPEPQTPKSMDHSHYDLRSLVAQAFYDPGVMPPVPDTNVAIQQVELTL